MECMFCGKVDHLYYNIKEAVWICHHCGEAGGYNKLEQGTLQYVVGVSCSEDSPDHFKNFLYWETRGFSDDTIRFAKLGYYAPLSRYTIPYLDGNKISNISFRASEEGQEPKYIRLPGIPNSPYILGSNGTRHVRITEGEVDALTLYQCLDSGRVGRMVEDDSEIRIIGIPGASFINDRLTAAIPSGAEVVAIFDNDVAGKRAAAKLRDRIPSARTVFPPAPYKDLNEFYRATPGGNSAVRELSMGRSGIQPPNSGAGGLLEEDTQDGLGEVLGEPTATGGIPASVYVTLPDTEGDWLIQDLWVNGALGFLAGEPKVMKSLLALNIGYAVAEGRPFVGKTVLNPGPVLLYQEEDNDNLIRQRLRHVNSGHGSDRLWIFTPGTSGQHLRLDSDDALGTLDDTIRVLQPRLVILDPLANMHSLEDENQAGPINKILERLRWIRDLRKCSFMIVHHMGKEGQSGQRPGQRMRGSSVFHAKAECALYVERHGTLLRIEVENKIAPGRVLEVKYEGNQFVFEDETGAGVDYQPVNPSPQTRT